MTVSHATSFQNLSDCSMKEYLYGTRQSLMNINCHRISFLVSLFPVRFSLMVIAILAVCSVNVYLMFPYKETLSITIVITITLAWYVKA